VKARSAGAPRTVLSVAYPFAAVGPDAVGGAEQVLAGLDAALVRAGHRSIVIGCDGSRPAGRLVAVPPPSGLLDDRTRDLHSARVREAVDWALDRWAIDVVHYHGLDFHRYLPSVSMPVLVTLHLPLDWYPRAALVSSRPDIHFVCVSDAQTRDRILPSPLLATIPNGVPVDRYVCGRARRAFALVLGRICPEKGVHLALDAAHRADMDLLVAGAVFPYEAHERYFRDEVVPRLDARRRFVGPVGQRAKRRLLARAACVVVPSLAPETSSLVAMEASASGTPVVALAAGALPDLVEHGRTGWVVERPDELPAAMRAAARLSSDVCRRTAWARFDARVTADRYLAVYEQVSRGHGRAAPAALRVEVLPERASSEDLVDEWRTLFERCPDATPFQSPDWLCAWWRRLARGEPRLATVRAGTELVGLASLCITRSADGCCLRFGGDSIGDYVDVLADPRWRMAVGRAVLREALRRDAGWDRVQLGNLPPNSPLLAAARALPRGAIATGDGIPCPAIQLAPTFEAYLGTLSQGRRRKIRRAARLFAAAPGARIEPAGADTLEGLLDALFALHGARWRARGERGVLADPGIQAFHRDVAARFLSAGLLRLWVARTADGIAGVYYGFVRGDRAYAYLGGFDPQYAALSPGSLLIAHAIDDACAHGCLTFDFLRGTESYKYAWGASDTPTRVLSAGAARRVAAPLQRAARVAAR